MPFEITNYDVLIDSAEDDSAFRLADENHVGNKRFEVFVNLHKEAYQEASARKDNDACQRIVDTVIDIVCNKCVPKGRFLEKMGPELSDDEDEDNGGWVDLGSGPLAKMRVHQALRGSGAERSSSIVRHQTAEEAAPQEQNEASKRRRRGSYARLRRSISESMLFTGSDEPGNLHQRNLNQTTSNTALVQEEVRQEVDQMDVVFNSSYLMLSTKYQNPGNGRFKILVDMHASKFEAADPGARHATSSDLVNTVVEHWKGRFWVDGDKSGQLTELNEGHARQAVERVLLAASNTVFGKVIDFPGVEADDFPGAGFLGMPVPPPPSLAGPSTSLQVELGTNDGQPYTDLTHRESVTNYPRSAKADCGRDHLSPGAPLSFPSLAAATSSELRNPSPFTSFPTASTSKRKSDVIIRPRSVSSAPNVGSLNSMNPSLNGHTRNSASSMNASFNSRRALGAASDPSNEGRTRLLASAIPVPQAMQDLRAKAVQSLKRNKMRRELSNTLGKNSKKKSQQQLL